MSSNGHADAGTANPREGSLIPGSAAVALLTRPEEIKRRVRELELPAAPAGLPVTQYRIVCNPPQR
jgi:hypothetical protein